MLGTVALLVTGLVPATAAIVNQIRHCRRSHPPDLLNVPVFKQHERIPGCSLTVACGQQTVLIFPQPEPPSSSAVELDVRALHLVLRSSPGVHCVVPVCLIGTVLEIEVMALVSWS